MLPTGWLIRTKSKQPRRKGAALSSGCGSLGYGDSWGRERKAEPFRESHNENQGVCLPSFLEQGVPKREDQVQEGRDHAHTRFLSHTHPKIPNARLVMSHINSNNYLTGQVCFFIFFNIFIGV